MIPLRDRNPRHGPALVTWALVAVNVIVFLYQLTLGQTRAGLEFIYRYAFVPEQFFATPLAEAPSLVTSAFLHGGAVHLISNMIFLLVFGDNVEDKFGKVVYLLFYLGGAAAATFLHGVLNAASIDPLVGASGAISAVLGAYIVLFPHQQVQSFIAPLYVPWLLLNMLARVRPFYAPWLPAWLFIGYWALVQFLEAGSGIFATGPGSSDQVAWFAHVGGFVFGVLAVLLFRRSGPRDADKAQGPPRERALP